MSIVTGGIVAPSRGLVRGIVESFDDAALDLAFTQMAALPGLVTFSRPSQAWDSAGTLYASNAPRLSSSGLLIEEARTQYLANPAVPATQTQTLAAGTYTVSMSGTGSVAVSGGATGTATASAPLTFTLAASVSVTVTPAGAVTWFNCQGGSFATSPILAAAAGSTRATDVATISTSLFGFNVGAGTVVVEWRQPDAFAGNGGINQRLFSIEAGSRNDSICLAIGNGATAGQITGVVRVGGIDQITLTNSAAVTAGAVAKAAIAWDSTNVTVVVNGTVVFNGAPTGMPTGLATLYLGASSGAGVLDSQERRTRYYNRRLPNSQLQALTT
jgi:hypothetical protein